VISAECSTTEKAHFLILLHLLKYISPGKEHHW